MRKGDLNDGIGGSGINLQEDRISQEEARVMIWKKNRESQGKQERKKKQLSSIP